ncbi:MAG TPA: endolytic transglycosylase MltG [Alphaproteobacteria bacterium]|nr:endolytic transglycosylase MltG [Alphaproteobacteria bacterium]
MRRVVVILLFAVLGLGILAAAGLWAVTRFEAPGPLSEQTTVIVPPGTGLDDIARLLADNGVIRSPRLFVAGVKVFGRARALKAGEYAIPANVSPRDAMELLQSGKTVVRKLTIAEGLSTAQAMAEIAAAEGLSGPVTAAPDEGRMLPETYHFSYGDSRAEMVARMTKAMDDTLAMLWAHREANLPIKTAEQALILASIVEKETARPEERPHVAAVFLNRLKKGMRLQSDPTVVYALTKGGHALGRALTHDDLETPSPYNTYMNDGLPPGPIDNPGRESIAAVTRPADSGDLYFVADGNGGHVFARTLDAHNRNVAKWRHIRGKQENPENPPAVSPSAGNGASPPR